MNKHCLKPKRACTLLRSFTLRLWRVGCCYPGTVGNGYGGGWPSFQQGSMERPHHRSMGPMHQGSLWFSRFILGVNNLIIYLCKLVYVATWSFFGIFPMEGNYDLCKQLGMVCTSNKTKFTYNVPSFNSACTYLSMLIWLRTYILDTYLSWQYYSQISTRVQDAPYLFAYILWYEDWWWCLLICLGYLVQSIMHIVKNNVPGTDPNSRQQISRQHASPMG